ncbi:Lhr family ATP-dependent helicase, partial [Mycobacterium avium]|uniref:Lhr family ATP-dependent helicase n=1 Tax=Mycobacterium avium TaxID=1764 RepID=UPI0005771D50
RRRSLAALRAQVEPVSTAAYGRFLPAWHRVGAAESSRAPGHSGLDGLMSVIEQLAGVRLPASALEPPGLAPRGG